MFSIRTLKKQIRRAHLDREGILYLKHTHPNIDPAWIDMSLSNIEFKIVSLEDYLNIKKRQRNLMFVIGLIALGALILVITHI